MEVNQIYNRQLKDNLMNSAIGYLLDHKALTEKDFPSLTVHIGYLFSRNDGVLEGLFRITASEKTFYFALQDGKMSVIRFNEVLYEDTINRMTEFHPCIAQTDPPETEAQKNRREKNNAILTDQDISTAKNLITLWDDEKVVLKDREQICKKALASYFAIQIACDISNGNYNESMDYFMPRLEKFGLKDQLNSKEQKIIDGTYSMQDAADVAWEYEVYWALCWCLGLVDDISDASEICDCDKAVRFAASCDSVDAFIQKCTMRSKSEILDMLDLYFRYNWAVNDEKVNPETSAGDLNPEVVIERRRGLEWLISEEKDWYHIDLIA